MKDRIAALMVSTVAVTAVAVGNEGRAADCNVAPDVFTDQVPPSATRARLAKGTEVVIVAIGSSSTVGAAAGGPEFAWPARLGAELAQRHPGATITVHNRAVAKSTAEAVLIRMDKDVLPLKPTLVIWETGTGDAVVGADLDAFRDWLQAGVNKLTAAGAEIMFVDQQFSRRTEMILNLARYSETLRAVASANGIGVFPRHDIMRAWVDERIFDFEIREPRKRQDVARRLYDCIGRAAATFIEREAKPQPVK